MRIFVPAVVKQNCANLGQASNPGLLGLFLPIAQQQLRMTGTSHQRQLLEMRRELAEVATTGAQAAEAVALDQSKVGRLSRMDALQAQALAQATQARRATTSKLIDQALERIEAGTYGHCLDCDEAINPKRLDVDPTAQLCIRCAENA